MADIHRRPGGPAPRMDGSHRTDVPRGTDDLKMILVPSDHAIDTAILEALRWADTHRDQHLFDHGANHVHNLATIISGLRAQVEKLKHGIHAADQALRLQEENDATPGGTRVR